MQILIHDSFMDKKPFVCVCVCASINYFRKVVIVTEFYECGNLVCTARDTRKCP